jgi:hypothetical protein
LIVLQGQDPAACRSLCGTLRPLAVGWFSPQGMRGFAGGSAGVSISAGCITIRVVDKSVAGGFLFAFCVLRLVHEDSLYHHRSLR